MSADPASCHTEGVRAYYDDNSGRFERLGQGGTSIHRAVWGPGATTPAAAFHYVDELILSELSKLDAVTGPLRVVDLGCGLGASLVYLATRRDIRGEGITISPRQAGRAAELIDAAALGGKVRCRQGDFLALPPDLTGADLAFSIEASVHSPDGLAFFREAGRAVRPDGMFIVCDDFLAPRTGPLSKTEQRWLDEFRLGWRIGSLVSVEQARALALTSGLELTHDLDLTPYLELGRPRDRWIRLLMAALRPFQPRGEYWRSLLGGNALQLALAGGVLQYRFLSFRRRRDAATDNKSTASPT
jgi:cyclopropane fatty-acyl-phospholipid synthase-like methyltransferase